MSFTNQDCRKHLLSGFLALLGIAALGYLIARTYRGGNDINVYLYAAEQLLNGQNIYTQNPYNFYLYSPLFALTLSPLTLLEISVARVFWMLVNLGIVMRLWYLLRPLALTLSPSNRRVWMISVIVLSLGFLNHNFALGQVTILILWLTFEGCYQVGKGRSVLGALLIAIGINIKIIPMLVLVYFGMKGYFKAGVLTVLFFFMSLIIPAVIIGFQYNSELLSAWKNVINPAGERFAFEDNDGCHSLNAVLPAYFFDFDSIERSITPYKRNVDYPRRIVHIPYETLSVILLLSRLLVLGIFLLALLPRSWIYGSPGKLIQRFWLALKIEFADRNRKTEFNPHVFLWEMGLLCLVTLLIFPHQMKYSMLYFVPAGAYLIMCMLPGSQIRVTSLGKLLLILAGLLMIVLAIMGREIIGTHLVDVLDYYHFMGIANLVCLGVMWVLRPRMRVGGE
ncbi:MAG TPA: glycosyltransferase family 87 protein [Saprospiraceae bacterium]|nr:glycosyltransferase family 87 protein [Saprospiraceae bacterium]